MPVQFTPAMAVVLVFGGGIAMAQDKTHDPETHLARGRTLEAADKYADAAAAAEYGKAIAADAKLADAYQLRGLVQFKLGKVRESIADFDKYIELNPKAKVSHWQRGDSAGP